VRAEAVAADAITAIAATATTPARRIRELNACSFRLWRGSLWVKPGAA
jgi:hypothetical protein